MTNGRNIPIGKTSSPFREPNTTTVFHFWLRPGVRINPFDFVVAEHFDNSRTVGIVDEIFDYTDSDSHITDFIGSELGNPSASSYIDRVSTIVSRANVLRNMATSNNAEELYMPVPSERQVFFADEPAISAALGSDLIRGTRIPAGLITQSNNVRVPVFLDSSYIIGPEAAHVNCSGISGLATKTSYLMFLIYSMYRQMSENLCIIIFNVKQSDLLHIDEEPTDLNDEDREMYRRLNIDNIGPFENVTYFLPKGRGNQPDSETPPTNRNLYSYSLEDVHDDLDLLFSEVPDTSYTIDAFVHQVRRDWQANGVEFGGTHRREQYGPVTVRTWNQMLNVQDGVMAVSVYGYPSHPTPPRIKREMRRLTGYSMFVENRGANEVYLGEAIRNNIIAGRINVIDIYRVPTINQPFIIGDVMRNIEQLYTERQTSDLPHLLIFIDELNTFAPAGETTNPITTQIIEIARKGRSRRTALFGAQQFKSEVHRQVWGNCTLSAIGRTGSAEIRMTPYYELADYTKNSIMTLRPGEMVLSFKIWRAPIKVRFPKPPYRRPSAEDTETPSDEVEEEQESETVEN